MIKRRLNPSSESENNKVTKSFDFLPKIPVFKSTSKISNLLRSFKDKLNPLFSKGVNSIPLHLQEIGRSIKTRLCEHVFKNLLSIKICPSLS